MSEDAALARLGKYELRGTLGKGAMGIVHDGWDPAIARRVAIKTVRLPDADDVEGLEALARFRREAQAAGRLTHPNIVGVYDYGETGDVAFIVMEFVDGRTLRHILDAGERLTAADALRLLGDVLDGLAYSHRLGVVHRDIKPANIILTASGRAKIADFGIARIESSSLTQAGTVLGTPAYMSPEQFMGQVADRRTDIYSAGVVLYQLLTGERPFEGSLTGIMHKALNATPPRPSEISVTAPPSLDPVVARAMARRPEDRFGTAEEFASALRDAGMHNMPIAPDEDRTIVAAPKPPPPVPTAEPGRRTLPIIGGIAVLAIAAGTLAFLLLPVRTPRIVAPAPPAITALPLPPPVPKPVFEAVKASLDRTLPGIPCTLVSSEVSSGGNVTLSGVAGAGPPVTALRAAVARSGAAKTDDHVVQTEGPYCGVLDVLRPAWTAGRRLDVQEADGQETLSDNQVIALSVTMPFSGALHVAYIGNDGTVSPLVSGPGYPTRTYQAGQTIVFGRPEPGFPGWQVGPPFGTDMIVVVASARPLFTMPLPASEPVDAYGHALAHAIANAGASVSPAVLLLRTQK